MDAEKITAIVLAAGKGRRMNSSVQKQFMLLCGKPVLYYSLKAFEESARITEIILVAGKDEIQHCRTEIVEKFGFQKVTKVIAGGKERYHSVYEGLKACENVDIVYIHDGARPFVDLPMIERAYETVRKTDACVVGMPVKDTIKISDSDGNIAYTPDRNFVWMIQTPQVFKYSVVKQAYDLQMQNENEKITDDAMIVEQMLGKKIQLTEGSYRNIKITTPEDICLAEALLENQ